MQDFFNLINQGWVNSLIGLLGIILAVLGIFSYRISKSTAKPCYQKSSLRLIGRSIDSLPEEVFVTFKGREVQRLTKTILIFWNNGTEVLDGKDIVPADPITISFDEGDTILSYKILRRTKFVNNFTIDKHELHLHQLIVNFDYLDPKDGLTLEILHDSEKSYPAIRGTMKGVPNGFVDLGRVYEHRGVGNRVVSTFIKHPKIVLGTATFLGVAMFIMGLLPTELREMIINGPPGNANAQPFSEQPAFFLILGSIYGVAPAFVLWNRRKKYPKKLDAIEMDS